MGRVVGTLFGLPFAAVGVGMLSWTAYTVWQAQEMTGWQRVDATVLDGGVRVNRGDDSETYRAWGEYRYIYAGQEYRSRRVAISSTADNIGSFQEALGQRLAAAAASQEPIDAWVNPDNPADAIIDRRLRWGFQIVKLLFGLVFGAVGGAVIWAVWRAQDPVVDTTAEIVSAEPWRANPAWQGEPIRSEARNTMRGAWLFAGLWNLVSLPLPFLIVSEVTEKQNMLALIGLVFPVVGVGLLTWAIRTSREWWRFGPAPVLLDPFPGAIGGHVGGEIQLRNHLAPTAPVDISLTLVRSSDAGESRTERPQWNQQLAVRPTSGGAGSRIVFQFDVPEHLAASDAVTDGGDYSVWRLHVRSAGPGPDLNRSYEIPVYATGARSERLDTRATEQARREQHASDDVAIEAQFKVRRGGVYPEIVFPMGRHAGFALMGMLFGGVFAGAGYFLLTRADAPLMGTVFALVGGLILLFSLYGVGNTLSVSRDGALIHARRTLFGVPIGGASVDLMRIRHFQVRQTMSSSSGTRHVVYYAVDLVDDSGKDICVGEGLRGSNGAEAMIRRLQSELRLPELPIEEKASRSVRDRLA